MKSWRPTTLAKYQTYFDKWVQHCECRKQNPIHPSILQGVEFLTSLFLEGYTYKYICSARSALSCIYEISSAVEFGKTPLVKRLMKGIFEIRPVFPKCTTIWNVKYVFDLFRRWPENEKLNQKCLSLKLVVLIALVTGGQRMQTIHKINLDDFKVFPEKLVIPIMDKLKQTKPNKHIKPLVLHPYLTEPKLCVTSALTAYLKVTLPRRSHPQLFLSYIKPFKPVTKDTIARWCKASLKASGIDVNKYSSHSSRAAASSFANRIVNVKTLIDAAGWSSEKTFATHYNKDIEEHIDRAILEDI